MIQSISIKWRNIVLLSGAELFAMSLWFSATAVIPQLEVEWNLTAGAKSWLTMSVQIGFVYGTIVSAVLNLPDRLNTRYLFGISALCGAGANAAIVAFSHDPVVVFLLRFLTGVFLAGVYPPGMKLIATWCKEDRGLGIGILVGALTVGSAFPHLLNAIPLLGSSGMPPWRIIILHTSVLALFSSFIALFLFRPGPYFNRVAPFNWRFLFRSFSIRSMRLANFGYLGHMWELYAMWTWAPIFLISSYNMAHLKTEYARFAGFAVIGIGAVGSVLAGALADRLGRTKITIMSLVASGICAVLVGCYFSSPEIVTVVCLIWGFAVVADSAQFSTAITELSDPQYIGTALTVQTSLGFLLTMVSIRIIPFFTNLIGWQYAFVILVVGPVFGIWSMLRLRMLPEAVQMASGNR